MIYISHRGNTNGPDIEFENSYDYIIQTSKKFNVEIDIWFYKNQFYFGHDNPKYLIKKNKINSLDKKIFWFHAKNLEALEQLRKLKQANYFWHENDKATLTNKGFVWTYPGNIIFSNSICVLPEHDLNRRIVFKNCFGICSDYIEKYI